MWDMRNAILCVLHCDVLRCAALQCAVLCAGRCTVLHSAALRFAAVRCAIVHTHSAAMRCGTSCHAAGEGGGAR